MDMGMESHLQPASKSLQQKTYTQGCYNLCFLGCESSKNSIRLKSRIAWLVFTAKWEREH
jgi:hypothetical protein